MSEFEKHTDAQIKLLMLALGNAYSDGFRKNITNEGLEERDLAFEAGLIEPPEMELSVYATQKRGRIIQLLSEISDKGWITIYEKPPIGAYRVFISDKGVRKYNEYNLAWWKKIFSWFK